MDLDFKIKEINDKYDDSANVIREAFSTVANTIISVGETYV